MIYYVPTSWWFNLYFSFIENSRNTKYRVYDTPKSEQGRPVFMSIHHKIRWRSLSLALKKREQEKKSVQRKGRHQEEAEDTWVGWYKEKGVRQWGRAKKKIDRGALGARGKQQTESPCWIPADHSYYLPKCSLFLSVWLAFACLTCFTSCLSLFCAASPNKTEIRSFKTSNPTWHNPMPHLIVCRF